MSQENLLGMDEGALRKLVSPPPPPVESLVRGCGRPRGVFLGGFRGDRCVPQPWGSGKGGERDRGSL